MILRQKAASLALCGEASNFKFHGHHDNHQWRGEVGPDLADSTHLFPLLHGLPSLYSSQGIKHAYVNVVQERNINRRMKGAPFRAQYSFRHSFVLFCLVHRYAAPLWGPPRPPPQALHALQLQQCTVSRVCGRVATFTPRVASARPPSRPLEHSALDAPC